MSLLNCLTILRVAGRIVKTLAFALTVLAIGLVVARTIAQNTDPSWQNVTEIRVICVVLTDVEYLLHRKYIARVFIK